MKFHRNPDALWREEDIERESAVRGLEEGQDVSEMGTSLILLHGRMHSLNLLGTEIWKRCEGKDLDEIVSDLEQDFEVDPVVLRQDVLSFLTNLRELGLIHEV